MSESEFIEQAVSAFRRKYPPDAGWLVCRLGHMMGLELLPAFLHQGKCAYNEDCWVQADLCDGPRASPINYRARPHIGHGPGLHDEHWFGTISLTWQGAPIFLQRQWLASTGLLDRDITLAATKDRSALANLGKELLDFWRSTYGQENRVYLINGGPFESIELPKMDWDDLILPTAIRADIQSSVESFFAARATYQKMGLPYRRGFLFVGPPGGGKTTAAKIIMANNSAKSLALRIKEDVKDSTIHLAFQEAARHAPSILLIEDLDKMVGSKDVSLSFLLNLLDGLDTFEGFLVIATSNEPEKIDQSLLHRPSRFDRVFHFGLPGISERRRLLACRSQGRFSDCALERTAEASDGLSMAYVQEVAISAILQAIHENREPVDNDLLASAKKLKAQYGSSQKTSGALPVIHHAGFQPNGGGE